MCTEWKFTIYYEQATTSIHEAIDMEDVYPSTVHHANNCLIANEERATNEYENALLT